MRSRASLPTIRGHSISAWPSVDLVATHCATYSPRPPSAVWITTANLATRIDEPRAKVMVCAIPSRARLVAS
jgi:hypothetical protein